MSFFRLVKSGGGGGGVKKLCMIWGDLKKFCPFKKYPRPAPAVYIMSAA